MNCIKCGAELPPDSLYCNICGKKQVYAPRRRRKRGNGQGSAIRRGRTWTARWCEGYRMDSDGKRKLVRKTKGGFKTETEALKYANNPPKKEKTVPTLDYYHTLWLSAEYQDLSESKQDAYAVAWKRLADIACTPMDELDIGALQAVVDKKATSHYTAKDMRSVLSALYKKAVADGNARVNLSTYIHIPKLEEKEPEPFKEDEIKKIWAAYNDGDRIMGCVLVMIYTGMMPGELFKLKKDMINYESREIVDAGIKTKERKRKPIVFPDFIAPVLADLVSTSKSNKGYVLGMNKWDFYSAYHISILNAGCRDLNPYSCRHTTATALATKDGISPTAVQKVMRHTKFSTTERYIHPDMEQAHAAIDTLEKHEAE